MFSKFLYIFFLFLILQNTVLYSTSRYFVDFLIINIFMKNWRAKFFMKTRFFLNRKLFVSLNLKNVIWRTIVTLLLLYNDFFNLKTFLAGLLRRMEADPKVIRINSNLWRLLTHGNQTFVQNSRSTVYIVFE